MTKQEFASRLQNACAAVTAAEQELTEIDSRFGDADHGLTMSQDRQSHLRRSRGVRGRHPSHAGRCGHGCHGPERRQCRPPVEHLAGRPAGGGPRGRVRSTYGGHPGHLCPSAGGPQRHVRRQGGGQDHDGRPDPRQPGHRCLLPAAMRPGCSTPPPRPRSRGPRPASSSSPSSAGPRATASRPSGPRMPGPPPWPISSRGWHGPERISIDFEREVLHI